MVKGHPLQSKRDIVYTFKIHKLLEKVIYHGLESKN